MSSWQAVFVFINKFKESFGLELGQAACAVRVFASVGAEAAFPRVDAIEKILAVASGLGGLGDGFFHDRLDIERVPVRAIAICKAGEFDFAIFDGALWGCCEQIACQLYDSIVTLIGTALYRLRRGGVVIGS